MSVGVRHLSCFILLALACAASAAPKRVVLIAGPLDNHPENTHEYEKNITLLKHCVDRATNAGVVAEAYFGGWPKDPRALDDADTIFLTGSGSDRKESDHPLYVGDHFEQLSKQMKRGCGIVFHHWSTFHPRRVHDQITEWVGGYFDYESGTGPNKWYSAIQTREWDTAIASPEHPIVRGVRPFQLLEEFYFNLRFRDNDPRLIPILLKENGSPVLPHTVGWAVERADGGRGFGFTGGHFYTNWWLPDFRKLVLNAILWTARAEVPQAGVESVLGPYIRVLIVTGHNHPAHDWRSVTAALVHSLEQDPRVVVNVSEQVNDLAAPSIRNYDLIVLNYVNWEREGLGEAARTNFTAYLKNGGGLALIHFANGAFHHSLPKAGDSDWPEFRQIARRVWDHTGGSGHDNYGEFQVKITDVSHPITAGLKPFSTVDELYFRQAGTAPIEPLVTARSKVTGRDEPMAWAYNYGTGRVFQTVLGHAAESVQKAAALIRRGSVWGAGREQLSFDPPAELVEKAFFRPGSPWTPDISRKRAGSNASPASASSKILPPSGELDGGGGHWGKQQEKDWVDNRWNQTDVGRFVSCILPAPGGKIRKTLAIRLGDAGEAAVCYNTATLALRAAWTGKFIDFDPARYGLINAPRIAGEIEFAHVDGWSAERRAYQGLHQHGNRVVLEYQVDNRNILESPWIEKAGDEVVFTRDFEIGPGEREQTLSVGYLDGADATITNVGERKIARLIKGDRALAVAVQTNAQLRVDKGLIVCVFPKLAEPLRTKLLVWSGDASKLDRFTEFARTSERASDPRKLTAPSPIQWTNVLTVKGQLGLGNEPYVIDTIPVPYSNPYKALMFFGGVDLFENGDAALCTLHGDVWIVRGIDDSLQRVTWKRFATGLFQPLGLRIVNGRIHVLGRDRITRLHDNNGDDEADYYENFCDLIRTSDRGHDYVTGLEVDSSGNFYYVDPLGVHRVSADGKRQETLASGWRNPNGMSLGPRGEITVAPQEGEWTPASAICEVKPGAYYGFGGPRVTDDRPLGYDQPLCYIPRLIDNSSGSQVWVTSDRWRPLTNQLLHLSFGRSSMMLILREVIDGIPQGAVVPLPGRFLSGAMRGAFSKKDGQLYIAGTRGWVSNAVRDGSFQRVRYTGKTVYVPLGLNTYANGIRIAFSQPLDRSAAEDTGSYGIERWNYRYSSEYGSKEYSVVSPELVGHDPVEIRSARLLPDGRSVFLEIADLRPCMQMMIKYNLKFKDGKSVRSDIYGTIHKRGPSFADTARDSAAVKQSH